MSNGIHLLRMLEPAVRPDGVEQRAVGAGAPSVPIEARSFDLMLRDAASADAATQVSDDEAQQPAGAGPLRPLAQVDRVENETLRQLMAHTHQIPAPSDTNAGAVTE